MSNLVRVRVGDREFNVGRAHAEAKGFEVLDESPRFPDGTLRRTTRAGGRPIKPKVSIAPAVEKKAATPAERDTNPPSSKEK